MSLKVANILLIFVLLVCGDTGQGVEKQKRGVRSSQPGLTLPEISFDLTHIMAFCKELIEEVQKLIYQQCPMLAPGGQEKGKTDKSKGCLKDKTPDNPICGLLKALNGLLEQGKQSLG